MKFSSIPFLRLQVGAILLVLGLSGAARAQVPAATPPDYSKVEIKTTKISDNFYTLIGQGGTVGVLAGPDGILMVDTQYAPLSEKIIAAVKQISSAPIRFVINTHVHGDHTGGDENFGKLGATIFSREELRSRLANPAPSENGTPGRPMPAAGLPMVTYRGPVTFHMNGEEAELIPVIRAHTDGDTMVRFHAADVIMSGDFFRSVGYPNIDRPNGGTLNGTLEGLGEIIKIAGPNTKIIPGHGTTVDRAAIIAHRDMILVIRDRVAALLQQGKTPDEILASHPTADYDSKVPQVGTTAERFIRQLCAELQVNR